MTTISRLQDELNQLTSRALVELEAGNDGTLFVRVESEGHRADRLSDLEGGDFCQGQNWIADEARRVLADLKSRGYQQAPFGGSINLGHSGGGCFFAVTKH